MVADERLLASCINKLECIDAVVLLRPITLWRGFRALDESESRRMRADEFFDVIWVGRVRRGGGDRLEEFQEFCTGSGWEERD